MSLGFIELLSRKNIMANKSLFQSTNRVPAPTKTNRAGGKSYQLSDAETLAQYVVTSCFNDVYYSSGKEQLDRVAEVCSNVEPELIAKAAVYGHQEGKMKDVPAYLLAVLSSRGELDLVEKIFDRVITNPKMLFNFVQIVRSGVTGRKSFGSAIKRLINDWITKRTGNKLFLASIGNKNPSLVDVIKMTHPKPKNSEQESLFGYLLGKDYEESELPSLVTEFENFKSDNSNPMPDMDFRALTNCVPTEEHWKQIAMNMPWNTLRMNLRNLSKHNVFKDKNVVDYVAEKISDPEEVRKWNAFPYQILTTYRSTDDMLFYLPTKIKLALQDALEVATENVPSMGENVAVCIDVSGSMSWGGVTGSRGSVTSNTRPIDVASLIAASIGRSNPTAKIVSWGTDARFVDEFNPRDSVVTNATYLSTQGNIVGHGTRAASAMKLLLDSGEKFDMVIFVSDCQSWMGGDSTLSKLWGKFKHHNKDARLVEMNLQAYDDSMLPNSDPDIMTIGGFSDSVFNVIASFSSRDKDTSFLNEIENVEL